jgi:hypothetical protein
MPKSAKSSAPAEFNYLEKWDTKQGISERLVVRRAGKFVTNYSITALKKAPFAPNSRKG